MPRKPEPASKSTGGTKPTQMKLTPDTLAAIDKIAAHYHLPSRTDAVRLAVHHVAESMGPITTAVPKKKS